MVFDDGNLLDVARVVSMFNPHAGSVGDVIVSMRNTAHSLSRESTYLATGGYMLTAFWPRWDRNTMHVKASIADHCFTAELLDRVRIRKA